jgi:hypothetical protein
MSYDWDKNCAVVDRLNYFEYAVRTTTAIALALTVKDLYYLKINYYPQKVWKRLPQVMIWIILVCCFLVWY